MLHLANGASTARLLRQAGLPGEVEDADDLWMEGPLGVAWDARAADLAARFGIPRAELEARHEARERLLGAALLAPEVTFWTEEDLFCQANLCEALRRFPPLHRGKVLLAAPATPGDRLGHLAPEALARRFEAREPLRDGRLRLAHRTWEALSSTDPQGLVDLLREDLSAWPALRTGLVSHLRRFPSTRNGLDVVEEETLLALQGGALGFGELLTALQHAPRFWPLGLGDSQLLAHLRAMGPLVRLEGDRPERAAVSLEAPGRAVLEGRRDALDARPLDRWVGGVHLDGRAAWRWDEADGRLVAAPGASQGWESPPG